MRRVAAACVRPRSVPRGASGGGSVAGSDSAARRNLSSNLASNLAGGVAGRSLRDIARRSVSSRRALSLQAVRALRLQPRGSMSLQRPAQPSVATAQATGRRCFSHDAGAVFAQEEQQPQQAAAEAAERAPKKQQSKKAKGGKKGKKAKGSNASHLTDKCAGAPDTWPEYIRHRDAMFSAILAEQAAQHEAKRAPIKVVMPDGREVEATAFATTPLSIMEELRLPSKFVVARVVPLAGAAESNDDIEDDIDFDGAADAGKKKKESEGKLWDLMRPLEFDCALTLCDFDSEDGRETFWHSSAHVMGQCMERLYGGKLTFGPAREDGFYYSADLEGQAVSGEDYGSVESMASKIAKAKQPFERIVLTKEQALEMFKFNKFKQETVANNIPDGAVVTAYRCGPLVDLCRGPHLPNTKLIKAFKVLKNSSAYWHNDAEQESLQRIYGVAFPSKDKMKAHMHLLEEAARRNHRKIGVEQELFYFNSQMSPGSCFWLPHGTRIYNTLIKMIRAEYDERGYQEVITPNVFNFDLWHQSGHAAHYEDDMFTFEVEKQKFAMKPMNCPGHCLVFGNRIRSYRELPLRMAEFGVLHRNELSGALSGLTRVRRFVQDDAHIFCTMDQIESEIQSCLEFMAKIYGVFGFRFELELSTRPEKKLGDDALWDKAEEALSNCLTSFCEDQNAARAEDAAKLTWDINPGDGAFYGPKIDITLYDALNRAFQCATVQLDFQLPSEERFNLHYADKDGTQHRPVIVHRAILGSVERFVAVLCEHVAGKWPFWLSPRQAIVIPISAEKQGAYAQQVRDRLHELGYYCDVDLSSRNIGKKIREAQLSQYNFQLVVGADELENGSVNIRTRDNRRHGTKSLADLEQWLAELRDAKSMEF